MTIEENKNQTNEPQPDSNSIVIYNSFEEAGDAHYKWLASLTPEQHLQNAVQLIKRLYSEELKLHPKIGGDFRID